MKPEPDRAEITRALRLFHSEGVYEVRAIGGNGRNKRIVSGYFTSKDHERAADAIVQLNTAGANIYDTLNPVAAQLISRAPARMQDAAETTGDVHITQRRRILIDCDPVRPANTSASNQQLAQALNFARAVRSFLEGCGWPAPVLACSGNGYHLIYTCDLPNDEPSRDLIRHLLAALATHFDTETIKLDKSVWNASRISKVYGVVAKKGTHCKEYPHRLSRMLEVPEPLVAVRREQITNTVQMLTSEATADSPPAAAAAKSNGNTHWDAAQVEACLTRGGLTWRGVDDHAGGQRWQLTACPFNAEHINGSAAVFLQPNGALGFKCLHNSCADKHWRDVRALIDGDELERRRHADEQYRTFEREFFGDTGKRSATQKPQPELIRLRTAAEIANEMPSANWALRPYLERDSVALLFGDFGTYKSFVVLDWGLRLSLGLAALGHPWKAQQLPVVLISAEGRSVAKRLRAWCMTHFPGEPFTAVLERTQLSVIEHPLNLSDRRVLGALIEKLDALAIHPGAIIVDTLSRNSDGTVEASTADAGRYLANIEALRQRYPGCLILLPHHVGHAEKGRIRGPIVLAANTDTLIRIERPASSKLIATLSVERSKDSDPVAPQALRLEIVDLGTCDADGEPVTSLAVKDIDPLASTLIKQPSNPAGKNQRQLLAALRAQNSAGKIWTLADLREVGRLAGIQKNRAREAAEALAFSAFMQPTVGGYLLNE